LHDTRSSLSAALHADPLNAELRLVYADHLEELGDLDEADRHRAVVRLQLGLLPFARQAVAGMTKTLTNVARALQPVADAFRQLGLAVVVEEEAGSVNE
jgi:uncharacterized protein (TIGR02996 family)